MDVHGFTVGPVAENCFFAAAEGAKQAIVVDPGDEAERLIAALDEHGYSVEAILLTHTHFDHVGAVAPLARHTGAPVYCPELEKGVLADIMAFVPWPGFGPYESYEADETVAGGEKLELDPFEFSNREKTLTGTIYGSEDPAVALPQLLDLVGSGRLELASLVGPSFPLDRADDAFRASLAGEPGRVLVTP